MNGFKNEKMKAGHHSDLKLKQKTAVGVWGLRTTAAPPGINTDYIYRSLVTFNQTFHIYFSLNKLVNN